MAVIGRPSKPIDLDVVAELCSIHCTLEDIASVLNVDAETVTRRLADAGYKPFSAFYNMHKGKGNASLRRAQWKCALDGDQRLLIWMGKQALGQKDNVEKVFMQVPLETSEDKAIRMSDTKEFIQWKKEKDNLTKAQAHED